MSDHNAPGNPPDEGQARFIYGERTGEVPLVVPLNAPDPNADARTRQIMGIVIAGGLALTLMLALGISALLAGGSDRGPTTSPSAVSTDGPLVPTGEAPSGTPPVPPATEDASATAAPSRTRSSSPTPRASKTTEAGSAVTASVTLKPASYTGPCLGTMLQTSATIEIRTSPAATMTYTLNGESRSVKTPRTEFSDTSTVRFARQPGVTDYQVVLKVTAPGSATDTATFSVHCT